MGALSPRKAKAREDVSIPAIRATSGTSSRALACTIPAIPIPIISTLCSNEDSPLQAQMRLAAVSTRISDSALPTRINHPEECPQPFT